MLRTLCTINIYLSHRAHDLLVFIYSDISLWLCLDLYFCLSLQFEFALQMKMVGKCKTYIYIFGTRPHLHHRQRCHTRANANENARTSVFEIIITEKRADRSLTEKWPSSLHYGIGTAVERVGETCAHAWALFFLYKNILYRCVLFLPNEMLVWFVCEKLNALRLNCELGWRCHKCPLYAYQCVLSNGWQNGRAYEPF